MAEELRNGLQRRTPPQEFRGVGVAQIMEADIACSASLDKVFVDPRKPVRRLRRSIRVRHHQIEVLVVRSEHIPELLLMLLLLPNGGD